MAKSEKDVKNRKVKPLSSESRREPGKTKRGPKPFAPTQKQRNLVMNGIATGATQETLALALRCSLPTLNKHFAKELKGGYDLAKLEVGSVAYAAAMQAAEDSKFIPGMTHYEKTRFGYAEKSKLDVTSDGEQVAAMPAIVVLPTLDSGEPESE